MMGMNVIPADKNFRDDTRKVRRDKMVADAQDNIDDKELSIVVALPYFGIPPPKFWLSLIPVINRDIRIRDDAPRGNGQRLQKALQESGVSMNFIAREGYPPDSNRNLLSRDFLDVSSKNPDSRMMCVDSDALIGHIDSINLLLECDVDIVTAIIVNGSPPHEMCLYRGDPEKGYGKLHFDAGRPKDASGKLLDPLIEVDACGFHFIMIKRKVFEKIGMPYFHMELDENREHIKHGADMSFCRKAKEHGFKIWCRTDVVVPHIKSTAYGYVDYKAHREIDLQRQKAERLAERKAKYSKKPIKKQKPA